MTGLFFRTGFRCLLTTPGESLAAADEEMVEAAEAAETAEEVKKI